MTANDMVLAPSTVLNNHETAVRVWLSNLSKKALKTQVNVAANHTHYKRFVGSIKRDHKFGSPDHAVGDLCEFDVWLKKLALGENRFVSPPPSKPAFSPLPATQASVAASKKPAKDPKDDPEKIIPLTPEQQTPYKEWWGKYQSGTPGPTPESKQPPSQKETGQVFFYRFMTIIHLFLVSGKWFFFGAGPTEMTPPSVT